MKPQEEMKPQLCFRFSTGFGGKNQSSQLFGNAVGFFFSVVFVHIK